MRKLFAIFGLALIACGCNKSGNNSQTALSSQESPHPIVALAPVIDSAKHDLNWNLSEELSNLLLERLIQRGNFYLTSPQKVSASLKKAPQGADPFSVDLSWIKQSFYPNEFVVFAEVVEHEEATRAPTTRPLAETSTLNASADLNISLRVRVVDLRSNEPKVTLQEMLHFSHHVPRQFTRANFYQVSWKDEHFHISPLGLAHNQLVKSIATRLEDYILSNTNYRQ